MTLQSLLNLKVQWLLEVDLELDFFENASYGSNKERLEREFDLDLITTAPTVIYEV